MPKIKIFLISFISVFLLLIGAKVALASVLAIQTLPSYTNTNNFKLSCSSSNGDVQFYVSKHGGAYMAFGPVINTSSDPCVVQVTSSEINDQTDYRFKANDVESNSTIYDASGPSPVSNYSKQRIDDGTYKLQWTNPGDADFDKVVIYRGDTQGFSADSSHEIARVSGGANAPMSYDDHFTPDSSKTYYYAIRALDHAGNSSSLAGDAGVTTTTSTSSTSSPKPVSRNGQVTQLPSENGTGSILSAQTSSTPTSSPSIEQAPTPQSGTGLFSWILGHKKISLGVLIILGLIGYFIYRKK